MINKIFIKENMCTIYKLVFHRIQMALEDGGYIIVDDPGESDICLAGLCAAFEADEKRSIEIARMMKRAEKPLYIYGCMTSVNPQELPEGHYYSSWQHDELVRELLINKKSSFNLKILPNEFRSMTDYRVYNPRKMFLGVTTGCSFSCSYCPHKMGSGKLVSISEKELLKQIMIINKNGAETLVITGIDTACYGIDINCTFSELLRKILDMLLPNITIHISQFNPEGLFITENDYNSLMDLFSCERITDIQLPIQTASEHLLKLMQRNYDINKLNHFLKHVKKNNPHLMLRTDLMVGFPTETHEDLDASIAFACEHYSEIAVYTFEMKSGTPISKMNLIELSEEEKESRRRYVVQKGRERGILVHSGGQLIDTLIHNDTIKENKRREINK